MKGGEYFITPYIVELMQGKVPFMVFYDNHQLLEGDEIEEWNQAHEHELYYLWKPERMLARHIIDKHGRSGYVLKDNRCIEDLTIPDEIIMGGYAEVLESCKEAGIRIVGGYDET